MTIVEAASPTTILLLFHSIVSPTMLLLDYQNALIQSLLTERFSGYNFPVYLTITP